MRHLLANDKALQLSSSQQIELPLPLGTLLLDICTEEYVEVVSVSKRASKNGHYP